MSEPAELPPTRSQPVRSERFRLAGLAREAALRVSGVVATDTGPAGMCVTSEGGARVEGVLCVASQAGGYDVALQLVCRLVPLHPLSDEVRAAVTRAAQRAMIVVDDVNVHVAALDEVMAR